MLLITEIFSLGLVLVALVRTQAAPSEVSGVLFFGLEVPLGVVDTARRSQWRGVQSLTAGVVDGSEHRVDDSSDEIDLVDHTSGLSASHADEYASVQPVEAVGPGLDCG